MIKYITDENIEELNISPTQAMAWVQEAFELKYNSLLPHKTSITYDINKFFNTMPAIIPELDAMGVKVVNRYPNRMPTIDGQILFYNYTTGNLTHMLDAFWITNARTGAVCATSVKLLAKSDFSIIAFMGLGNTARSSLSCILEDNKGKMLTIKLLKYKTHCEEFISIFKSYKNITFLICDKIKDLIEGSDVIISCITNATELLADPKWFKDGSLLIPVHTKGFQSCDLVFNKVVVDDIEHVSNFKYFDKFKKLTEISEIMLSLKKGRENDLEKIISYNIGIALHDIVFSKHIINMSAKKEQILEEVPRGKSKNIFSF